MVSTVNAVDFLSSVKMLYTFMGVVSIAVYIHVGRPVENKSLFVLKIACFVKCMF